MGYLTGNSWYINVMKCLSADCDRGGNMCGQDRCDQAGDEQRKMDLVCDQLSVRISLRGGIDGQSDRLGIYWKSEYHRSACCHRHSWRHDLYAVSTL